jgi:Xaa-Pro aminopeptidase
VSRLLGAVSREELARRWDLARGHLVDRQLDAVIAVASDANLDGGYVRWLTHEPFAYRRAIVFHAGDLMTSIEHGPQGVVRNSDGDQETQRGVGEIRSVAMFPAVGYSNATLFDAIADVVDRRGYRAVGLLGGASMPHGLIATLEARLGGRTRFTDDSEFFDAAIARKSAAEQALIRATIGMQSRAFEAVLEAVRPGMRDLDVTNLVKRACHAEGGMGGIALAGSAPPGTPAPMQMDNRQGRTIAPGDTLNLLIETTGPGGYYAELGRTLVFGRAPAELQDAFALALEAQTLSRSATRPGAAPADVFAAYNRFLAQRGQGPELRVHSHSQGYDIVSRPLIRDDETLGIAADMFFSVHPGIGSPTTFAFLCDNFFVGRDAAGETLHAVPQQLFEV